MAKIPFQTMGMHWMPLALCVALLGTIIAQSPPNIQPNANASLNVRYNFGFLTPGVQLTPARTYPQHCLVSM